VTAFRSRNGVFEIIFVELQNFIILSMMLPHGSSNPYFGVKFVDLFLPLVFLHINDSKCVLGYYVAFQHSLLENLALVPGRNPQLVLVPHRVPPGQY